MHGCMLQVLSSPAKFKSSVACTNPQRPTASSTSSSTAACASAGTARHPMARGRARAVTWTRWTKLFLGCL